MNIKKIGLTALAGSLVATSAYAGELTLSGAASLSYSDFSGNETDTAAYAAAESNWGMDQDITASGSGELDNGWVVSLSHAMAASGATSNTSSITVDMGDAGTLVYSDKDIGGGLKALDDITPTAWEEATDGHTNGVQAAMGNGTGFSYALPEIAGAKISIMYSENLVTSYSVNDGQVSTSAADNGASHSIGIQYPVGDSVTIYGGIGTEGQADGNDIDHQTIGVKATFGAVSVGIQRNDEDDTAASSATDLDTTIIGVSFMVNENLSISYGTHSTSSSASTTDQDIDSIQAAYSMGGISVKAQNSKAEGVANATGVTSEKTEIMVSFAF